MDQPREGDEPGPEYVAPPGPGYAAPGRPASGQAAPGNPAYGYPASSAHLGHPAGPAVAPLNTSAVVLLVVSGLCVLAAGIIGIPSAVVAVLALRANRTDPATARRTARLGWIVLAVNAVVGLALIWALFRWLRSR